MVFSKERLVYVGLCIHAQTIKTHVPEALRVLPSGDGSVDVRAIVAKLFRYPPADTLAAWFKNGLIALLLPADQEDPLASITDAARMTAMSLLKNKRVSEKDVRKEKFYVVESPVTTGVPKAYLVIVGSLVDAPKEIPVVRIDTVE